MDIQSAISNLLSQNECSLPETPKLTDIVDQIVQLSPIHVSELSQPEDASTVFEQLAQAARSGQIDIFRALVQAEKQRTSEDPTLLMAAVMANQFDVVKVLIAAGADVNAKITHVFDFNALDLAVSDEKVAIAQLLLEAGADPNWINDSPGFSPLIKAIKKNNIELVKLLLKHNANVIFKKANPLVEAAEHDTAILILDFKWN